MKRARYIWFLIFIVLSGISYADTLTIMHYNLMYYDKIYSDCNNISNNVDSKDGYLRTILRYVKPDILAVNEVNDAIASVERIKTNTLNIGGENRYKRANFSGSFLVNMIYYNSDKVELKGQDAIPTSPRETNLYIFYLKTRGLSNGDTIFLYHFVTHLKAGSTPSDAQQRATAASAIMNYISTKNITGNVIISGDMNLYGASEGAFVAFTTPTGPNNFRFYDPLNKVGEWHENYNFRNVHTQSTRTVANEGCFSIGGFDDRFDFILTSADILSGKKGVKYYSYKAIGQDGNRYNSSLISPANTSIPTDVANALYGMSDHIPVVMKVTYSSAPSSTKAEKNNVSLQYNNPVTEMLTIQAFESIPVKAVNVYSILGNKLQSIYPNANSQKIDIDLSSHPSGFLLVEVILRDNRQKTIKILKK